MQIENETPFAALAVPNFDVEGRETASVVVKGSFSLAHGKLPEALPPEEQVPIVLADEYWGDPGESPVRHESDLAPFKPGADLILLGFAQDPRGRPTKRQKVSLRVDRWESSATATSDEAVERIPLHLLEEMRRGGPRPFRQRRPRAGFGFYPRQLKPRAGYAGTYDERWREERAPFLPEDFDYRFFQAAFPELVCDRPLRGDEALRAEGVSPGGVLESALPGVGVEIEGVFRDRSERGRVQLDTLILEPEARRMSLVWRAMFLVNGDFALVRGFRVRGTSPR